MRDTLQPAAQGGEAQPLAHSEGDAVIQPSPASTAARLRAARGEEGLTTLEWLLIVAAVAGLAVVAVVIVTRVVNQTADQLASANPTVAAAQESARTLVDQFEAAGHANPLPDAAKTNFTNRCNRLRTSFGTAVDVVAVVDITGTPTGTITGHSLDPDALMATNFMNVETWRDGGTSNPIKGSAGTSEFVGCFVRQRPTP